jgi:hypothetical protein
MAAAKPEVLISRLADLIAPRFQPLRPCFRVNQSKWTIGDPARPNRKWKIKDGGLLAASKPEVFISQLPDKIQQRDFNGYPQVFESSNPIVIFRILCDATGSQ